jgi:hypothetical protein
MTVLPSKEPVTTVYRVHGRDCLHLNSILAEFHHYAALVLSALSDSASNPRPRPAMR